MNGLNPSQVFRYEIGRNSVVDKQIQFDDNLEKFVQFENAQVYFIQDRIRNV